MKKETVHCCKCGKEIVLETAIMKNMEFYCKKCAKEEK